jgi:hypothetical protein
VKDPIDPRRCFGTVAGGSDRHRPGVPEALVDCIAATTRVAGPRGARACPGAGGWAVALWNARDAGVFTDVYEVLLSAAAAGSETRGAPSRAVRENPR